MRTVQHEHPVPVFWTDDETVSTPRAYAATQAAYIVPKEASPLTIEFGSRSPVELRDKVRDALTDCISKSAAQGSSHYVLAALRETEKDTLPGVYPSCHFFPELFPTPIGVPKWFRTINNHISRLVRDEVKKHAESYRRARYARTAGTNVGWPFLSSGEEYAEASLLMLRDAGGSLKRWLQMASEVASILGNPRPCYVRFARDRPMSPSKVQNWQAYTADGLKVVGTVRDAATTRVVTAGSLSMAEPARPATVTEIAILKKLFPQISHKSGMGSFLRLVIASAQTGSRARMDGAVGEQGAVLEMDFSRYDSTVQDELLLLANVDAQFINSALALAHYSDWNLDELRSFTLSWPVLMPSTRSAHQSALNVMHGIRSGDITTSQAGIRIACVVAIEAWRRTRAVSHLESVDEFTAGRVPADMYGDDCRIRETDCGHGSFSSHYVDVCAELGLVLKQARGSGFLRMVFGQSIPERMLWRRLFREWPVVPALKPVSDYAAWSSCSVSPSFRIAYAHWRRILVWTGAPDPGDMAVLKASADEATARLSGAGVQALAFLRNAVYNPAIAAELAILGIDIEALLDGGALTLPEVGPHMRKDIVNRLTLRVHRSVDVRALRSTLGVT